MKTEEKKIEHHHALKDFAAWLVGALKIQGVSLAVVGKNALHVTGEITVEQKESLRIWKRQIIEALSPKCPGCNLSLELIENGNLWFCPLGCKSMEVKP